MRDAFFLTPFCETGSLLTKQVGTSVRLGARTPESGVMCGHSPRATNLKTAGTKPQNWTGKPLLF